MHSTYPQPKSIINFMRDSGYNAVPKPDTAPFEFYALYHDYCQRTGLDPASQTMFTKTLRTLGYHKVSVRLPNNHITKMYRYTGEIEIPCVYCHGTGRRIQGQEGIKPLKPNKTHTTT